METGLAEWLRLHVGDVLVFEIAGRRIEAPVTSIRQEDRRVRSLASLVRSDIVVTTSVAAVGVRGTEFWAGPIDDQALGVFLIEGAVSVSNAAGEQILSQPGQGTNIATPGAVPGLVTFWPPDKVNRAIATVTFQ